MELSAKGLEQAKERAALLNAQGRKVYIYWDEVGIPRCPICHKAIDKKGKCYCGVEKFPDEMLTSYLACCNTDVDSFRKEADRARKRYEEKRKKGGLFGLFSKNDE